MNGPRTRRLLIALALVLTSAGASGMLAAGSATAAPAPEHHTGTLPDGASWIADVPSDWNGTLLLYSHGYGPLNAADAPDPATKDALLGMGYALAGSSYDPNGSWWALGSAVRDQFETLAVVKQTVVPARTKKVYAFGTSMGGLISALEDQKSDWTARRRADDVRHRRRGQQPQPVSARRRVCAQRAARPQPAHPAHTLHRRPCAGLR